MKKTIIILIIVSFFVSWSGPLSSVLAATADADGANHGVTEGAQHYCEISKGPCKHNGACPLKDRHEETANGHDRAHHHGEEGSAGSPYLIASKCHGSSDTHQTSFYTIEHLFITTLLLPPARWDDAEGFFSRDEPQYSDNISCPLLRPPRIS